MRKFFLFPLLFLAFACTDSTLIEPTVEADLEFEVAAKKAAPNLNNTIDYELVAHLGIPLDGEGRALIWFASIEGDIDGTMVWWFLPGGGPPSPAANVSFYSARWEIWESCDLVPFDGLYCSDLILAGNSSGATAQARDRTKDGIWRGNGVVTEAYGDFEAWNGRRIFEGGNVDWTFPFSGQGIFRVN